MDVVKSCYAHLVESNLDKDFQTRFKSCRKALRDVFPKSNKDATRSQTLRHKAETDDYKKIVDPKIQFEGKGHESTSPSSEEAERAELVRVLAPSFQSVPPGCHEGTRTSILREIKEWVNGMVPETHCPMSRSRVLRLIGGPGTGKTTVPIRTIRLPL